MVQLSKRGLSNLLVLTILVILILAVDGKAGQLDETVRVEGLVTYDGRLPEIRNSNQRRSSWTGTPHSSSW